MGREDLGWGAGRGARGPFLEAKAERGLSERTMRLQFAHAPIPSQGRQIVGAPNQKQERRRQLEAKDQQLEASSCRVGWRVDLKRGVLLARSQGLSRGRRGCPEYLGA